MKQYILIEISVGGIRFNIATSKYKRNIINYLKDKEYYYSKAHGLYIDNRSSNSSIDYTIEEIEEWA